MTRLPSTTMRRFAPGTPLRLPVPLLCAVLLTGLAAGCQRDAAPPAADTREAGRPSSSQEPPAPAATAPAPEATPAATAPATPAPGATAPPARPTRRFAEALRHARYPIDTTATGQAPLTDGLYEETVAGSSGRNVVRIGPAPAFGDLDGDGVEDAAVTLLALPGGSGSFTYLAAVLNADGAARPTAAVLLGDRIAMQAMHVVDGRIVATWLDRKPGEPMSAAPTTRASKTFAVQGGKLVAVGDASNAGTSPGSSRAPLRGYYTWGAEVETFRPCGSRQVFWAVGDKALLQPLRDRSTALATARGKPYQPVYLEASGVSEGKASDGFAADYDGVYRLQAVRTVGDSGPADCK